MMIKGKKAGVILYGLILVMFVVVVYGLYSTIINVEGVKYSGESSQRVLSAIELANRILFYIDVAVDQSIKKAILDLEKDSGFLIERSANYQTRFPCEETVYPLLNKDKKEVTCFPDYQETFFRNFQRELRPKLHNFKELSLSSLTFTEIFLVMNNELILNIYFTPLTIPTYSHFGSYYDQNLRREISRVIPSYGYQLNAQTRYYERKGLTENSRGIYGEHPDSIVFHYTAGHNVDDAYNTLLESGNSYHYIIEKDGRIFSFIDESKAAQHAGCQQSIKEGNADSCKSGYNQRSIGISFVNLGHAARQNCTTIEEFNGIRNQCWENYPQEQITAAVNLVADIVQRQAISGNFMKINQETITTHQEIDPKRKSDPGPLFDKNLMIARIKQELTNRGYTYEI